MSYLVTGYDNFFFLQLMSFFRVLGSWIFFFDCLDLGVDEFVRLFGRVGINFVVFLSVFFLFCLQSGFV